MVIGNFFPVDYCACMNRSGRLNTKRQSAVFCQSRKRYGHILGQIPAVRAGIRYQFLFIKALRIVQRLLCRKAEETVGFPLKCCQVIESWRLL